MAPAVPSEFPELQRMSAEDLVELLVDDKAYAALVHRLAADSQVRQVARQLAAGNADMARANLEREAEMGEIRNQIAIIRCVPAGATVDGETGMLARGRL